MTHLEQGLGHKNTLILAIMMVMVPLIDHFKINRVTTVIYYQKLGILRVNESTKFPDSNLEQ